MKSLHEEQPFLREDKEGLYRDGEVWRSSWRLDQFWERLADEWKLYHYHLLGVGIWTNMFVLWFITLGILRNIAYWRHVPSQNLPDIAFDFIKENNDEFVKKVIEICFFTVVIGLSFLCMLGNVIYQPPHMPRMFATTVLFKGICGYHFGLFLRAFIFCSTSIPGSASHCHPDLDPMYWVRKPKSLRECFTFVNLSYPNCGDLIFSGHVFSTLFLLSTVKEGTRSIFGWHPRFHKWLFILLYVGIVYQSYEILAVRNHYLADVLIAFIFSPMFIHWFDKIWIFDIDPREKSR